MSFIYFNALKVESLPREFSLQETHIYSDLSAFIPVKTLENFFEKYSVSFTPLSCRNHIRILNGKYGESEIDFYKYDTVCFQIIKIEVGLVLKLKTASILILG